MNDSEYFKKRYQLFIRFIKENNLYEEYRRIREKVSYITHILENVCVSNNTMLGKRMFTKGQTLHMLMVATDVKSNPTKKQTYSDFYLFYQFSNFDICTKIEKLKPKWKRIINKLENKQL